MRQLNDTGYMHNRVRMLTASFLVKNMGINWRHGEHYFAAKLMDFDSASNNGNCGLLEQVVTPLLILGFSIQ